MYKLFIRILVIHFQIFIIDSCCLLGDIKKKVIIQRVLHLFDFFIYIFVRFLYILTGSNLLNKDTYLN